MAEEQGVDDEQSSFANLCSSLPPDLVLRVISSLPSPLLFECRTLSKNVRRAASLALARRPFIVYQNPSAHCFLLPLDAASTPLPLSFRLGESPFKLAFASSNLLCLARLHASVLSICICSVFCNWKFDLPPIVHPRFASRLHPCVLVEDRYVNSLTVVGFEALPAAAMDPHASHRHANVLVHGADGHAHVNVADGHVQTNNGFPCNFCHNAHHFRVLVTDFDTSRRVFDSCQQQWSEHDRSMLSPATHGLMVAGARAKYWYNDRACKLEVSLPHVKDAHNKVLVLEAVCPTDRALEDNREFESDRDRFLSLHSNLVTQISDHHRHCSRRYNAHSSLLGYRDKLYVVLIDFEILSCMNRDQRSGPVYHHMTMEEAKKYLWAQEDIDDDCTKRFPALTPCRLMLFTVHIDTTTWTLHLTKENASALLELSKMSKLADPSRRNDMGKFFIMEGGGAPH